jgi:hypothetical protein
MQFDEQKAKELMGRMVGEFGAIASAPLVALGDRPGLYKTMSEQGWMTSTEVAERTELAERYVREWLAEQAASGFVRYDAGTPAACPQRTFARLSRFGSALDVAR